MERKSYIDIDWVIKLIAREMDAKKLNAYDRDEISEIVMRVAEDVLSHPAAMNSMKSVLDKENILYDSDEDVIDGLVDVLYEAMQEYDLMALYPSFEEEPFSEYSFIRDFKNLLSRRGFDLKKVRDRRRAFDLQTEFVNEYLKSPLNKAKVYFHVEGIPISKINQKVLDEMGKLNERRDMELSFFLRGIIEDYFKKEEGIDIMSKINEVYAKLTENDIKKDDVIVYHGEIGKVISSDGEFAVVYFDNTKDAMICHAGKVGIPLDLLEKKIRKINRKSVKKNDIFITASGKNFRIYKITDFDIVRNMVIAESFDKSGSYLGVEKIAKEDFETNKFYDSSEMDMEKISKLILESADYTLDSAISKLNVGTIESIVEAREIYITQGVDPSGIDRIIKGFKQGKTKEELEILIDEEVGKLNNLKEERKSGKSAPIDEGPSTITISSKYIRKRK